MRDRQHQYLERGAFLTEGAPFRFPERMMPDTDRKWASGAFTVAIVSIATTLLHGWVPLDEGAIALSARYVAAGYLPHHDFVYPYTGALPYGHALATWLFGDTMAASRYTIMIAFVAWLPAVWILARRFVPPATTAMLVVLAAWWSVLIYPAAMPTWYLLFITTWTLVALARWNDGNGDRWLIVAGVLCGVAIIIKQTGIYTFLGCVLGVLALHQAGYAGPGGASRAGTGGTVAGGVATGSERDDRRTGRRDPLILLVLALAVIVPVLIIVRRGAVSGEALVLALPLAVVLTALVAREFRATVDHPRSRGALFSAWGLLSAAAVIPVAALVLWYASHGALQSLADGALGQALLTAGTIEKAFPSATVVLGLGMPVVGIAVLCNAVGSPRMRIACGIACALAVCVGAMYFAVAYQAAWYFAVLLVPLGAIGAAWRSGDRTPGDGNRAMLLAVAAAMSLLALNQFPYAAPNYFGYVAPLAIILAVMLGADAPPGGPGDRQHAGSAQRLLLTTVRSPFALVLLLVFGGWFHRIGGVATVGHASVWWDDAHMLTGTHAGIFVTTGDSARYTRLTRLIAEHGNAETFIAGPELPELFVLAGTRRLIRQPYRLVDAADPDSAALSALVDTSIVRVVAINHAPLFLPRTSPEVTAWLAARYPHAERVGEIELRWR